MGLKRRYFFGGTIFITSCADLFARIAHKAAVSRSRWGILPLVPFKLPERSTIILPATICKRKNIPYRQPTKPTAMALFILLKQGHLFEARKHGSPVCRLPGCHSLFGWPMA